MGEEGNILKDRTAPSTRGRFYDLIKARSSSNVLKRVKGSLEIRGVKELDLRSRNSASLTQTSFPRGLVMHTT